MKNMAEESKIKTAKRKEDWEITFVNMYLSVTNVMGSISFL